MTRNALRPIKRMRDKLDGLGFLDYRVAPVVSTIDDLLSRIPGKGAIEGSILQEIFATAMLLADPVKTRQHGQGLLAAQGVMSKADVVDDDDALQNPSNNDHASIQFPVHIADLFDGIFDESFNVEKEGVLEAVTTEGNSNDVSEQDYWL